MTKTNAVGNDESNHGKGWTPRSERREAQAFVHSSTEHLPLSSTSARAVDVYAGEKPANPELLQRLQGVTTSLFMQRIVRLGGAVDDDMANVLVAQLLYLDSIDKDKDIVMYINSPGGSVTAGMAVFDTMRHVRPAVSTCCVGLAASMGAFLLASGEKGKRLSLPNSRIMIHQPLGSAQGQAADMEIQCNEILHHKLTLSGYLANFTGQTIEKITVDTDRDFFMSAKESVDYGLIDAVVVHPLAGVKYERAENYKERILASPDTITVAGPGNKRKHFIFDDDLARMDEAAKEEAAQGKSSSST